MSEIDNNTEEKRKLEGVIFIQYTEHSTLAKNIRRRLLDIEKVGQLKIKLVERAGDKLEELLHRSDAWSDRDCDRADCLPCKSAGEDGVKGSCKRRNVIYETYCISCQEIIEKDEEKKEIELGEKNENKRKRENMDKEKNKVNNKQKDYKIKYIGESYRSAYERGREHQDDLKYLRERSHLLKHFLEAHPNEKIEDMKYGMRLVSKCKTALERQVGEAVHIQLAQENGYTLLNSKSEYSRCTIPQLRLGDSKGLLEQLEGERQSEKNMKERIRLLRKRKDSNEKKKKKEKLEDICNEIMEENRLTWKRRKVLEGEKKREQEEKDRLDWERFIRIEKAKRKKEELLRKLEKKEIKLTGKSVKWIRNKQKLWRNYREKIGFDSDDERELFNRVIENIPVREKRDVEKNVKCIDEVRMGVENVELEIVNNVQKMELKRLNCENKCEIREGSALKSPKCLENEVEVIEMDLLNNENKGGLSRTLKFPKSDPNVPEKCEKTDDFEMKLVKGDEMVKDQKQPKAPTILKWKICPF